MTSVEGAVMDFASAPGRWLEMSARHDVHVELGKDVGDERSEETRTGHWGVRPIFTNKIQQNDPNGFRDGGSASNSAMDDLKPDAQPWASSLCRITNVLEWT